jgi:hypothetical protein
MYNEKAQRRVLTPSLDLLESQPNTTTTTTGASSFVASSVGSYVNTINFPTKITFFTLL